MKITAILGVLIILPLGICGCGGGTVIKREYLSPGSEEGRSCVRQCEGTRVECREKEKDRAEEARSKAQRQYELCVSSGGRGCIDTAYQILPRYEGCEWSYDRCFEKCGGQIREGKQ